MGEEECIELPKVAARSPAPRKDYTTENSTDNSSDAYAIANPIKKKKLGSFPRPEVVYQPEKIESWMTCLKCSLVVINLFIWILGAVITCLAIWVELDSEFWEIQIGIKVEKFATVGYVLIVVGILIMLIGFIGCYGSLKENMCFLLTYGIVMAVVIILELVAIGLVATAISKTDTKDDIRLRITIAAGDRPEDEAQRYFIDLLQSKLQCCGITSYEDYTNSKNPRKIPPSCISEITGQPYDKGCYDAVMTYLKSKADLLGGISAAIFVLQLGALLFTGCLYCGLRQATANVF